MKKDSVIGSTVASVLLQTAALEATKWATPGFGPADVGQAWDQILHVGHAWERHFHSQAWPHASNMGQAWKPPWAMRGFASYMALAWE